MLSHDLNVVPAPTPIMRNVFLLQLFWDDLVFPGISEPLSMFDALYTVSLIAAMCLVFCKLNCDGVVASFLLLRFDVHGCLRALL